MAATNFYQPNPSVWDPRPFQSTPPANPITWVQGSQQVETYPVQYGGTVVLWDKEQPVIYIKSVDNFGNASVQILDYEFRKNTPVNEIAVKSEEKVEYVKKEDFDKLQAQINELINNKHQPNRKFKED